MARQSPPERQRIDAKNSPETTTSAAFPIRSATAKWQLKAENTGYPSLLSAGSNLAIPIPNMATKTVMTGLIQQNTA